LDKALVTGATGLVGFNLVQALLNEGREVRALVRSVERGRQVLPAGTEPVQGDITDPASVRDAVRGCSAVYHAAGLPEQWLPDRDTFRRVNVQGTQNMIEAALAEGVAKFVYVSTVDVFAAGAGEEFDETRLDPQPKATPYERSKQEADRAVVAAIATGLPAVFIHPAGVYGPGPATSPGLNEFIRLAARGKVPMVPPGIIPVVFAPDLAAGCLLAGQRAAVGERYILSESCLGFRDIARLVGEECNRPQAPRVMPLWLARAVAVVGEWVADLNKRPPLIHRGQLHLLQWKARPSSAKAQRDLGWRPIPFREGVKKTLAFLFPQDQAALAR
jgi:nucleoside-diphosphate-sugar epimerase